MRKIKNGRIIKRLAARNFKAERTRNIIAVVAIILTTVLFTAVFTIGAGIIEETERNSMLQAGGDAHGAIKELSQEQYDILKKHPLIKECGRDIVTAYSVNNKEFLKRHVEMHYLDKNLYPHWFINILDGKAPEKADEILLDQKSLQLMGIKPEAGCKVTLEIQVHAGSTPVKRTFTVSGVTEAAEVINAGFAIVPEAYIEKYAEEIKQNDSGIYSSTGKISMHVIFANSADIQERLDTVITESGFSADADSADYIASNANWAYLSDGAQNDPLTLAGIVAALGLVVAASYLIIYNIFQISIIRDIRYYGLLKTIGTTGRQIKRILRKQALWLCISGIPAGLIAGFFTGKLFFPIILVTGKENGAGITVSPEPWIFICAVVLTVVTVLISEWKPAKIAARVSPVEAVRYTEHSRKYKKPKKTTDGGKITRMAFSNLGRNKGRTVVVICSLSLTVVLMNSVYTITNSINRETFLSKMILSEGIIGNAVLWNYNYRPYDEKDIKEMTLSESFVAACKKQESFKDGGRIYMSVFDTFMPVESYKIPDNIEVNKDGIPGHYSSELKEFFPLNGYEEGEYTVDLHGIERFVLSKMTITEGEKDKDKIWDKLQTGRYIIYAADVDDDNSVIENTLKHHAGDKIVLKYNGKNTKEYEIISVIKGHTFSLTNRVSSDFPYYVSADEFKKNLSDKLLMSFLFDVKEGQEEDMEKFLESYTSEEEPLMSYESRKTYEGTFKEILGMIAMTGTGLSGVIGLIGILNFINVIITSVETRKREFAMMEAIGMTKKQLAAMLRAEGIFYPALSIIFSLVAGTAFSLLVVKTIGDAIWFIHYKFTLLPVLIACPVLLAAGALVPGIVFALRKKESIVERIRE